MTNEHQPHEDQPHDDHLDLEGGDIDLTGSVGDQTDSLRDVIGDAIVEARGADGEVPEWGARAIARALANLQHGNPYEVSALHQFAATGTGDAEQITTEAMRLYQDPESTKQVQEWINYLGTYLIHFPPSQPRGGEALTQVSTYLDEAFRRADEAGTTIGADDARAIATLIAGLLPSDSAMRAFADTAAIDLPRLRSEIDGLTARVLQTPQIRATWLPRLGAYLDAHQQVDTQPALSAKADEGITTYGNAFRAYLELPDIDPTSADVLTTFHANYVGSFIDTTDLLERLTELSTWRTQVRDFAAGLGIEDLVSIDLAALEGQVREVWDIVTYEGMLYAFEK